MAQPGHPGHGQYRDDVMADIRSATANWFSFGWLAPTVALANAVVLIAVIRYLNPSTLSFLTDEIDRVTPLDSSHGRGRIRRRPLDGAATVDMAGGGADGGPEQTSDG